MQNNVFLRLAQERYTTKHYKSLIRCLKFCV